MLKLKLKLLIVKALYVCINVLAKTAFKNTHKHKIVNFNHHSYDQCMDCTGVFMLSLDTECSPYLVI